MRSLEVHIGAASATREAAHKDSSLQRISARRLQYSLKFSAEKWGATRAEEKSMVPRLLKKAEKGFRLYVPLLVTRSTPLPTCGVLTMMWCSTFVSSGMA